MFLNIHVCSFIQRTEQDFIELDINAIEDNVIIMINFIIIVSLHNDK